MVLLILFLFNYSHAQDERDFREWISPIRQELGDLDSTQIEKKVTWKHKGPLYKFNLGGDDQKESIQIIKKDGVDWVYIYDSKKKVLAKSKLEAQGYKPYAFKIRVTNINKSERVLMIHYFQGQIQGKDYYGQGKVFLWAYKTKSLMFYPLRPGPRFLVEKMPRNYDYSLKKFKIKVYDVNKDGSTDIVSRLGSITKIYLYAKKGIWEEL